MPTKVPYNLATGRRASSTAPGDWLPYREASDRLTTDYAGLGFVFNREQGIAGVDLDDCMDDLGEIKPWAIPILQSFSATYAEISPSGHGIKLWCRGKLPGDGIQAHFTAEFSLVPKNDPARVGSIEMYDNGRYFAVTGRAMGPLEIADCQFAVDSLYKRLRGKAPSALQPSDEAVSEGNRHSFLLATAARWRNDGLDNAGLLAGLRQLNQAKCNPPKPDDELQGIVNWLGTKPPKYRLVPKDLVNGSAERAVDPDPEPALPPPPPTDHQTELSVETQRIISEKDLSELTGAYSPTFIRLAVRAGNIAAFAARQALKKACGKEFVLKGVPGAWDVRFQEETNRYRTKPQENAESWRDQLILTDKGSAVPCYENAALFAENSPDWAGVLGYNDFTAGHVVLEAGPYPVTAKPGEEIEDHFDTEVTRWFERQYLLVKPEVARRTVDRMARMNSFHPVRDYLAGLPAWDKVPRIATWLIDYCRVSPTVKDHKDNEVDNLFAMEAGARFLISAVARVMRPGCKADHVLMLEGKTGIGKSTTVELLAGKEFFTDQLSDLGSKDASMQIRGIWIAEIAELHALTRAERERAKGFVSQTFERFRLPYGKRLTKFLRQCVFIGTTENSEWNTDERGARRFWPVLCEGTIDTAGIERDRDQLWAEALDRYQRGDRWHLYKPAVLIAAEEVQASRYAADVWQDDVIDAAESALESGKRGVSIPDILTNMGIPAARRDQTHQNRVSRCLRYAKWDRRQVRQGDRRTWRYFPSSAPDSTANAATS